jgi:hypothetical protein
MHSFPTEILKSYRAQTYRTQPGQRLASPDEAVEFVNKRGFIFFWPIKGTDFPSLWTATAGDRPVADEHDDPGHMTWGWKDQLLGKKRWYYGRVLRQRNAMISLEALPYFYVLSPNLGDPDEDYQTQYLEGTITAEAKSVFEALLKEGPLDTISLRKAARLSSSGSDGRFNKALNDLQMEFKLLPTGISEAGAWHYAFIYDLTHRHFPELISQAGHIYESAARQKLALWFYDSLGAAPKNLLGRFFGWKSEDAERTLHALIESGQVVAGEYPGLPQAWIGLPHLAETILMTKE